MGYNSKILSVLYWVGMILFLLRETADPVKLGIPPIAWNWITLLGTIASLIAGKLGASYLGKGQAPDFIALKGSGRQ